MKEPCLYLLMRNDLDSMNAGKAIAHGAHAANQFVYELQDYISSGLDLLETLDYGYKQWQSTNGFGDTVSLSVSLSELQYIVGAAKMVSGFANGVIDPTYPYVLHKEYADLIQHDYEYPPKPVGDGKVLCVRSETTCGYIFGDRRDLRSLLKDYPLVP